MTAERDNSSGPATGRQSTTTTTNVAPPRAYPTLRPRIEPSAPSAEDVQSQREIDQEGFSLGQAWPRIREKHRQRRQDLADFHRQKREKRDLQIEQWVVPPAPMFADPRASPLLPRVVRSAQDATEWLQTGGGRVQGLFNSRDEISIVLIDVDGGFEVEDGDHHGPVPMQGAQPLDDERADDQHGLGLESIRTTTESTAGFSAPPTHDISMGNTGLSPLHHAPISQASGRGSRSISPGSSADSPSPIRATSTMATSTISDNPVPQPDQQPAFQPIAWSPSSMHSPNQQADKCIIVSLLPPAANHLPHQTGQSQQADTRTAVSLPPLTRTHPRPQTGVHTPPYITHHTATRLDRLEPTSYLSPTSHLSNPATPKRRISAHRREDVLFCDPGTRDMVLLYWEERGGRSHALGMDGEEMFVAL